MNIDSKYLERLEAARRHLALHGVVFDSGLTGSEIKDVEERFSFVFPPDLRWFLQASLPASARFPNWRSDSKSLQDWFDGPFDGISFDIRNGVFWWPDWGHRPTSNDAAIAVAMKHIEEAPRLIPIYGHSYLPGDPCDAGNPVFSVHQADVIHRGADLAQYLFWIFHSDEEAEEENYPVFSDDYRWIPFWSALAKENAR